MLHIIARLESAAEAAEIPILTSALVTELLVDGDVVRGVSMQRPDGSAETIGCDTLVLACNGYGGNRELVSQHIPPMADAPLLRSRWHMGDALLWGKPWEQTRGISPVVKAMARWPIRTEF